MRTFCIKALMRKMINLRCRVHYVHYYNGVSGDFIALKREIIDNQTLLFLFLLSVSCGEGGPSRRQDVWWVFKCKIKDRIADCESSICPSRHCLHYMNSNYISYLMQHTQPGLMERERDEGRHWDCITESEAGPSNLSMRLPLPTLPLYAPKIFQHLCFYIIYVART